MFLTGCYPLVESRSASSKRVRRSASASLRFRSALWAPVSRCEQGCNLSLDRLRQQRSCAAAQHLRQRIGKSSRLGELENASQPQIDVPSPSTTIALKHPYFADDMKLVSYADGSEPWPETASLTGSWCFPAVPFAGLRGNVRRARGRWAGHAGRSLTRLEHLHSAST